MTDIFKATGFYLALPRDTLQDVRAWLIAVSAQPAGRHGDRQAVLATERITVMVIRGGRLLKPTMDGR
jgi:hypothetical protein